MNVFAKPSAAGAKQTEAVIYAKMSIEMFVNPPISVEQLNRIVDLRSSARAVRHFDSKTPHFCHVVVRTFHLGSYIVVGGDQAMWMVLFFAIMVSLGALGLLTACENQ
jgi:hypothetical protein